MAGDYVAPSLGRVLSPDSDEATKSPNSLGRILPSLFSGDISAFISLFSIPESTSGFSRPVHSLLSPPVMQSGYGFIGKSISCESN